MVSPCTTHRAGRRVTATRRQPGVRASLGTAGTAAASPSADFRNDKTGRCIDDSLQYGLRSFPCNGLNYQAWAAIRTGSVVTFKNKATGRCIDDSFEAGLRAFPCNNLPYQAWRAGI